jgi:hypothetical protein
MPDLQKIVVDFNQAYTGVRYVLAYVPESLAKTAVYGLVGPCKAYLLSHGFIDGMILIFAWDPVANEYSRVVYRYNL